MSNRSQTLSWLRAFGYFLIEALALAPSAWADVSGGISTDGTMGAGQILNGANLTVPQSLGTTVGNNLFHSFTEFNIANGQTVRFTGSDALHNVVSRVTGTDVTEIEGTLRSTIANAAFYFINPNGITFGTGAQVNVPGAFHISTADKIDFANHGGSFYADSNQTSTLSAEAPAAFGFLGTSTANNGL
ncbi:MAG: filamentous hemagglutinin N-terminal domain-containing protein, partial [Methylococcaceae bacterium]